MPSDTKYLTKGAFAMSKEQIKKEVKVIFRNYRRLDSATLHRLEHLGFSVVKCAAGHYKLYFIENNKAFVTFGATPSDHRAGMNLASLVCKLVGG